MDSVPATCGIFVPSTDQSRNLPNTIMVLVFKTSVQTKTEVDNLAPLLNEVVGDRKWNFDLEDCDKVLRVLPDCSDSRTVISVLRNKGYECIEFED